MAYKVLLVDDDPELQELLEMSFGREGFSLKSCALGSHVLDQVRAFRPDLLILDIGLPDMDGLALLKMLKATEEARELPALILSAKDRPQDAVLGFHCGAEDYLAKPLDVRELLMR